MKKIYLSLTALLSGTAAVQIAYAAPTDGETGMLSQIEAVDFIALSGLIFIILGLVFIFLSLRTGRKIKNIDEDFFEEAEFPAPSDELNIADTEDEACADDIGEEPVADDTPSEPTDNSESERKEYDDSSNINAEISVDAEEVCTDDNEDIEDIEEAEEIVIIEEPKIRITLTGTNNPDVRFAEFTDRCSLGRRNTNDIMISDNAVSGNHCEFIAEEDKLVIRDLNSTNGTLLNGVRITAAEIKSGDLIIVGKLQYRISVSR